MQRFDWRHIGFLVLASLAGGACALDSNEPADVANIRQAAIWTPQGMPLLGKTLDGLGRDLEVHLGAVLSSALDRNPGVDDLWTEGGELVALAHGQELRGQTLFDAMGSLELAASIGSDLFRVTHAEEHVLITDATRWEYDVLVLPEGAAQWQSLCGGARAFVVDGLWQRDGRHDRLADTITFACPDGVAAKCIHWGYQPEAGQHAWDRHQACTRMARADYCGDGSAHTFDGTEILLYDGPADRPETLHDVTAGELRRAPTVQEGPLPDGTTNDMWFEAAWRPDGAFCLSKLRWQTLPLGGFCPNILPDPRLPPPAGDPDPGEPAAVFCEDYLPNSDPDELSPLIDEHGVRVFDSSMRNDLGLYRWEDAGGSVFSTSSGLCGGASGRHSVAPATGFDTATLEGTLLSAATVSARQLQADVLLLKRWMDASGRYATSTADLAPGGYVSGGDEGHVFAPDPNDDPMNPRLVPAAATAFVSPRDDVAIVPLFRYTCTTSSATAHHTTTATAAPAGFCAQRVQTFLEGWILQPAGGPGQACEL